MHSIRRVALWAALWMLPNLVAPFVLAQEVIGWPAVTREELDLKDDPFHPGAAAIILEKNVFTDEAKCYDSAYVRLKIFNEHGKKYADLELPYWNDIEIEGIRGRTIRADGTINEFQGQVYDKTVVQARKFRIRQKTFSLPAVESGGIIEYAYRRRWKCKNPDVLKHPERYQITGVFSLPSVRWTLTSELSIRHAVFALRPITQRFLQWKTVNMGNAEGPRWDSASEAYRMELKDSPATLAEEYAPPGDILGQRVQFYYLLGYVSQPADFWREIGKQRSEYYEKFIGNSAAIRREAQRLTVAGEPREATLRRLYERSQQVRAIGQERTGTGAVASTDHLKENSNADDVLNHGYAWGNEVNLFFMALARAAGFEASVVEVTSRDSDLFHSEVLDSSQLNSIVVIVRVGTSDIFLDPATHFCPYGMLPWSESSVPGIRIRPGWGGVIERTPDPISSEAAIIREAALTLEPDGTLSGRVKVSFTGQQALFRRYASLDKDAVGLKKSLEDEVKAWVSPEATVELVGPVNWDKGSEPLRAEFDLKLPRFADVTSKRMLLQAGVFRSSRARAFEATTRKQPVLFDFPWQEADDVSIQLPANAALENAPSQLATDKARVAWLETKYVAESGALQLHRRINIGGIVIQPEYYMAIRSFFQQLRETDEQKILLSLAAKDASKK